MAVDKVLVRNILDLLGALGDWGREIDALATEVGIRMDDRHMTVQRAEAALQFAKSKGWVAARDDEWGTPRWYITDAGSNRQAMM